MVVEPWLRRRVAAPQRGAPEASRSPSARLEEAVGLTRAIDLEVVEAGIAPLAEIRPAT